MGDPNPNHFLVHSALVLPPLVVQRSSYEAGEFCIEKNPEVRVSRWTGNHRSIDLPILGWLEKMSGSTVPAVVDVVPVLGRFLEWLFLKSCMKQEKETHTHTHTLDPVFSTTWAFRLNPWHPEKNQSPQKTHHLRKKKTSCQPPKKRTAHWDNWSAIALICWSFLPCVVPVSLVWLHRLRRLPLGALRWPLPVEKVPWNGKW